MSSWLGRCRVFFVHLLLLLFHYLHHNRRHSFWSLLPQPLPFGLPFSKRVEALPEYPLTLALQFSGHFSLCGQTRQSSCKTIFHWYTQRKSIFSNGRKRYLGADRVQLSSYCGQEVAGAWREGCSELLLWILFVQQGFLFWCLQLSQLKWLYF